MLAIFNTSTTLLSLVILSSPPSPPREPGIMLTEMPGFHFIGKKDQMPVPLALRRAPRQCAPSSLHPVSSVPARSRPARIPTCPAGQPAAAGSSLLICGRRGFAGLTEACPLSNIFLPIQCSQGAVNECVQPTMFRKHDVRHRNEHEQPLSHPRVRQRQFRRIHLESFHI